MQVNDILDRWVALVRLSGIYEVITRTACSAASLMLTSLQTALQSHFWTAIRRKRRWHVHACLRLDSEETCSAIKISNSRNSIGFFDYFWMFATCMFRSAATSKARSCLGERLNAILLLASPNRGFLFFFLKSRTPSFLLPSW